jgi:hypothetical protein
MDTNAFCTFIGCRADSDCPGGWWCARVDDAPNASSSVQEGCITEARAIVELREAVTRVAGPSEV